MAISDIVVIGIFVVTVIVCTVKGLALTLYSIFSSLVAIIGAFLLRPFVSAGLIALGVDKLFYDGIYASIEDVKLNMFAENQIGTGSKLAEGLNIPDFAKGLLKNDVRNWETSGSLDTITEEMSKSLSDFIIDAISIILLVIIILVLMHFLKKVLTVFSKIPVIKQINRIGGFFIGFVLAFFWISIAGMVIHLLSASEVFPVILADLDKSIIAHYFYDTNFIALILSGL